MIVFPETIASIDTIGVRTITPMPPIAKKPHKINLIRFFKSLKNVQGSVEIPHFFT